MANRQTTPGIQPVRQGLVDSQPQQLMPQISWQSPLRDVAGAMEQAADFTKTYQNLRFEEYQAKYDNLANQMYHEMEDATDPCQLGEIKKKYDEQFAKTLDNTIWASSYNNSRYKKDWMRDMNINYEKVYLKKMHEFSAIQAERTLNEMSSAAVQTDDVLGAASYFDGGMNLIGNMQHLTPEEKNRFQMAYARDFIGKLYTKNPNFALSFAENGQDSLAKYGIDINDIRNKAQNYNLARERERIALEKAQRTARNNFFADDYEETLALYYQGKLDKASAEQRLLQNKNNKGYNDFVEKTKPGQDKSINNELIGELTSQLDNLLTEDEVEEAAYNFTAAHSADMNSATLARANDIIGKKKATALSAQTGGRSGKSSGTSGIDYEFIRTNMPQILASQDPYGTANELMAQAEVNSSTSAAVTKRINDYLDSYKSRNEEKIAAYKNELLQNPENYQEIGARISSDDTLTQAEKNTVYAAVAELRKAEQEQKAKARAAAQEKSEAAELKLEQDLDFSQMVSQLDDKIFYDDGYLAKLEAASVLREEQVKSYKAERDNKIQTDALLGFSYRMDTTEVIPLEDVDNSNLTDENKLEMRKNVAVHNETVYKSRYEEGKQGIVTAYNSGQYSYDTAVNAVVSLARQTGQDVDAATAELKALIDNTSFNNNLARIMSVFKNEYGDIDETDLIQKNARQNADISFSAAVKKDWDGGKDLSKYTEEYIRGQARQYRMSADSPIGRNATESIRNRALGSGINFKQKNGGLSYEGGEDKILELHSLYATALDNPNIVQSDKNIIQKYDFVIRDRALAQVQILSNNENTAIGKAIRGWKVFTTKDPYMDELAAFDILMPYLRANGFTSQSAISQDKANLIVSAAFYDQFPAADEVNYYGRIISQQEIERARNNLKDIRRPGK